jgi:pyrroline-5-carboxylate reductase
MADGGVMMGLPRAEALELAAQSTSAVVVNRSAYSFNRGST